MATPGCPAHHRQVVSCDASEYSHGLLDEDGQLCCAGERERLAGPPGRPRIFGGELSGSADEAGDDLVIVEQVVVHDRDTFRRFG
jgi:hypothetical protein